MRPSKYSPSFVADLTQEAPAAEKFSKRKLARANKSAHIIEGCIIEAHEGGLRFLDPSNKYCGMDAAVGHSGTSFTRAKKIATVLAAAPELLEALKELLITVALCFDDIREFGSIRPPNGFNFRKQNESARTAISKAEGK